MAKRKAKKVSTGSQIPEKMRWHAVPLKSSFMVTAMLGFLISAYWVYPQNMTWGIAFLIVFAVMFVASLISMSKAPIVFQDKV